MKGKFNMSDEASEFMTEGCEPVRTSETLYCTNTLCAGNDEGYCISTVGSCFGHMGDRIN